jgi:hypothetical protein
LTSFVCQKESARRLVHPNPLKGVADALVGRFE